MTLVGPSFNENNIEQWFDTLYVLDTTANADGSFTEVRIPISDLNQHGNGIVGNGVIDVDKIIEELEGCSIKTIFKIKSEKYFRELEKKTTLELLKKSQSVIALGGGAFGATFDTAHKRHEGSYGCCAPESTNKNCTILHTLQTTPII